jgi:uncharacterized protein YerC
MKSANLKRDEGAARNAAWRELSTRAQIDSLDRRLGTGKGAKRQRTILYRRLHESTTASTAAASTDTPVASKAEERRRDHKKGKAK